MSKLNVIFILGTLEENKCGVSDYVRRVCAYLGKKENSCTCIAINDKHICTENRLEQNLVAQEYIIIETIIKDKLVEKNSNYKKDN